MKQKRIAVITPGGDTPGMNACVLCVSVVNFSEASVNPNYIVIAD